MDNGRTSLDMETKVALMAALIYDGPGADITMTVQTALEIEQESHRQVVNLFRERKLARSE